jgi:hypothetical protein
MAHACIIPLCVRLGHTDDSNARGHADSIRPADRNATAEFHAFYLSHWNSTGRTDHIR